MHAKGCFGGYLPKFKRGHAKNHAKNVHQKLVPAFSAHFLHDFFVKMFLI